MDEGPRAALPAALASIGFVSPTRILTCTNRCGTLEVYVEIPLRGEFGEKETYDTNFIHTLMTSIGYDIESTVDTFVVNNAVEEERKHTFRFILNMAKVGACP